MHNVSELCCYCQNLSTLKNPFFFFFNILLDTEQILNKAAQIVPKLVWCIGCDSLRLMLHIDIFDGCCIISALILSHKNSQSCDIDGLLMSQMKIYFYHNSFLSLLSVFIKVYTLCDTSAKEIT